MVLSEDELGDMSKEELCSMNEGEIRTALQNQTRYSRKRRREYMHISRTGEENLIRKLAKTMNVNLGKQVEQPSGSGCIRWWHKGRKEIIEDIVSAIVAEKRARHLAATSSTISTAYACSSDVRVAS